MRHFKSKKYSSINIIKRFLGEKTVFESYQNKKEEKLELGKMFESCESF
jgi:hypothetical protein